MKYRKKILIWTNYILEEKWCKFQRKKNSIPHKWHVTIGSSDHRSLQSPLFSSRIPNQLPYFITLLLHIAMNEWSKGDKFSCHVKWQTYVEKCVIFSGGIGEGPESSKSFQYSLWMGPLFLIQHIYWCISFHSTGWR